MADYGTYVRSENPKSFYIRNAISGEYATQKSKGYADLAYPLGKGSGNSEKIDCLEE